MTTCQFWCKRLPYALTGPKVPMKSPAPAAESGLSLDDLLVIQLRVARRADELVSTGSQGTASNFHCWFLAEAEVWKTLSNETSLIFAPCPSDPAQP